MPAAPLKLFFSRMTRRLHFILAANLAKSPATLNGAGPIISFTFDDFPRSALHTGGAILQEHSLEGTYYIAMGLVGRMEPTGEIARLEDLPRVLEQHHELGCHTYSHCHASRTPPRQYEQAILQNLRQLRCLFPAFRFLTHSFPLASPSLGVKAISAPHFIGCRAGGQAFNPPRLDLNFLKSYFIEQSRGQLEPIRALIGQNAAAKGWLIFATHDVCEHPTAFGCTPRFLEKIIQISVESGARILPVGKAIESFTDIHGLSRTFTDKGR